MGAIYKHEIHGYLTTMSAYVFGAFILLFAGIYTAVYNVQLAVANFEYSIQAYSFVFLITVPVLTMKIFAEERRQKTDQLLYSLPVSMFKIVMGKYLGLLTVFAVPVLIISIYPLALCGFGRFNFLSAYGSIIGFFLLGAALMAIGMFISSLTESLPVSAGVCFIAMLLNYFLVTIVYYLPSSAYASFIAFMLLVLLIAFIFRQMTKNTFVALLIAVAGEGILLMLYTVKKNLFLGLFPKLAESLSIYHAFESFTSGIFDLRGVVMMLSVIVFFVFLTVQTLEKRRWS